MDSRFLDTLVLVIELWSIAEAVRRIWQWRGHRIHG